MSVVRRVGLILGLGVLSVAAAPAWGDAQSEDLARELEASPAPSFVVGSHTLAEVIPAIQTLRDEGNFGKKSCEESRIAQNSNRMVTTIDGQGKLCKIYDLSFPVLFRGGNRQVVGQLSLESFDAGMVRGWLRGDESAVMDEMARFRSESSAESVRNSWYGALRFKEARREVAGSDLSFRLSDLDLGQRFTLSPEEAGGLRRLAAISQTGSAALDAIVTVPESLLEKIEFRWNGAEKIFEIVADLDFLPVAAPVALVDYQIQYKYVVEKLVRSAILNALNYAIRFIPNPTARTVVGVALQDSFEFVEMAYQYQMNRLENTLEMNLAGRIPTTISRDDVEKGLNILFAQRSDLVTQYILARVLHQKFDLNALDQLGRTVRYSTAKSRESTRAALHSELVLKKGCATGVRETHFALCTLPDATVRLYSLLSRMTLPFLDLGPAVLHDFSHSNAVGLRRQIAWQLSTALRVLPLQIPARLNAKLVSIVKDYARSGALDEAYLLNAETERVDGDEYSCYLKGALRKQSLVPFAFSSSEGEDAMVRLAGQQLESRIRR